MFKPMIIFIHNYFNFLNFNLKNFNLKNYNYFNFKQKMKNF